MPGISGDTIPEISVRAMAFMSHLDSVSGSLAVGDAPGIPHCSKSFTCQPAN